MLLNYNPIPLVKCAAISYCGFRIYIQGVIGTCFLLSLSTPCLAVSIELIPGQDSPAACGLVGTKEFFSVVVNGQPKDPKMSLIFNIEHEAPIGSSIYIQSRLSILGPLLCSDQHQNRCYAESSVPLPLNDWMNRQMLTDIMVGRAEVILNRKNLIPCRYQVNPPDSIQAVAVHHFSGEMAGSLKFSFAHHSCAPEVSAEWTGKQKAIPSDLTFTRGMDSCSYRLQEPNGKMLLTAMPGTSKHSNSHGKDPTIQSLSLRLGTGKIVQMVPPK